MFLSQVQSLDGHIGRAWNRPKPGAAAGSPACAGAQIVGPWSAFSGMLSGNYVGNGNSLDGN